LTVGGGAVRFPIEAGGALKEIIEAPSLDDVRGLDARTNIGYAVEPGAASDSEPDVHEDYVSAYDLGRFAESARFVRHYPEQNPVLRDLLPKITTPTQIVAGRDDDLVPWSNNQYLDDLLPNSEIHPLDAGHFAWEQQPGNTAAWSSTGSAAVIGASPRLPPAPPRSARALAIGETWCLAAVWHAGEAADAESGDREHLARVGLAGQSVVVQVGRAEVTNSVSRPRPPNAHEVGRCTGAGRWPAAFRPVRTCGQPRRSTMQPRYRPPRQP
jgi:hypothetical protein